MSFVGSRTTRWFYLPACAFLISVPFIYNSCQKGFSTANGISSGALSLCKVTLEKGQVKKLELSYAKVPRQFRSGKVVLSQTPPDASNGGVLSKASADPVIPEGSKLAVILDNVCAESTPSSDRPLTDLLLQSQSVMPQIPRQAYNWTLDQDYLQSNIEAMADADACVVGLSWQRKYKVASFNDSAMSYQEHLSSIQAPTAWDEFYNPNYGMKTSGDPVIVAVLDTGIDWQHPDLQAHIWQNSQGWGVDATTMGTNLLNFNPFDISSDGHGTNVSGIIAAVSNNSMGIVGTMPYRAKIMAIKIFNIVNGMESTTTSYFYNGLQFAAWNKANVINLSVATTGTDYDTVTQEGFDEALAQGITIVTALGNGPTNSSGQLVDGTNVRVVPAIYDTLNGVIGVGSFDSSTGHKSDFSNYSTTYGEIAAPGAVDASTGIYSTLPVALGSYGRLMGTSQATPMVSAAAALTIGTIRDAYGTAPSPAEVERLIEASADKSNDLSSYFKNGNRLNLYNLVEQIHHDYPQTLNGGSVLASDSCN